jgi:glycerol-3-phosphate cytidylyltransferase-like family protein
MRTDCLIANNSLAATDACRWVTKSVGYAPYVTQLPYISHYGCRYVVHGDDITSDSDGNDCYRYVKEAGRFKVVKRSPGISTTDLVGRMLLCTKTHFIKSLKKTLAGEEGVGTPEERKAQAEAMLERIKLYATDETAKNPGVDVWFWHSAPDAGDGERGSYEKFLEGAGRKPGQRVVYVDGGFDLFSSGHIAFLRKVLEEEDKLAREAGWFSAEATEKRKSANGGKDYGPAYVVAGVHEDRVINEWKGVNYPIMNIYERGLCVLQCKVCLWRLSSLPQPTTDYPCIIVHQRRCFRSALYPDQELPHRLAVGRPRRGVSRPNGLYAPDIRPVHGAQGDGHLPADWRAHVFARQRGGDCAAHHEEPRHVRGAAAGQGGQGRGGGGGEGAGAAGGGAAQEGGREGGHVELSMLWFSATTTTTDTRVIGCELDHGV